MLMNNITKILLLVLVNTSLFAQKSTDIKSLNHFFPKERASVLVVGTFHFDYPNMDVIKTEDKNKIDVLKEPKKQEVTELVDYIKKFKPNKIAIEANPNWKASEKLKKYKNGEYRDKRDERYQIGMRIATELKLDTIYSIDAGSFVQDLEKLDSLYIDNLFKDFDFKTDDPIDEYYKKTFEYDETLVAKMNLLEYIKRMNSEEYHRLDYGNYLIGDFKLDDHRGADILSVWWYSRNLRIFRKIQQITTSKNDRILIIIGNGHAAILRQLLECSPEYNFVEFDSLNKSK